MTAFNADEQRFIFFIRESVLKDQENIPTRAEVVELVNQAAGWPPPFGYDGDLRTIINEVMAAITTRMGLGVSLVEVDSKHDPDWMKKRQITWYYHDAYKEYLQKKELWSGPMTHTLGEVTEQVLGYLKDPCSEDPAWSRRGLVIGHVQSGKTANYTGLIARAADAGYKLIIVMAGIHNNLRTQTQKRIDRAFIGRSSAPGERILTGVGEIYPNYLHPVTITNEKFDFNKQTAMSSGWEIDDFDKPVVMIIKKNVTTLSNLHKWLKELNARGGSQIVDVPMLLIDDEADHASVNTNREEHDPTRTNEMIRRVLNLFAKTSYVGYTATPFANIFINPEGYDPEVLKDLFPKDFIYCLDAPNTYFGAKRVFTDNETDSDHVRVIDDAEDILPMKHKMTTQIAEVPQSLYDALSLFIVARAIRNLRGQSGKHCSMMVNVSRFVAVQNLVVSFLGYRIEQMKNAVAFNYKMPEEISSKNEYMQQLKRMYDKEYAKGEYQWAEVKSSLYSVFDHLEIYSVNGTSRKTLDYDEYYKREGAGLTAITVGGLSLSRGLTVEGLIISYMYRNTKMYDTLMQMGRWFGYRPGYEDLCRVYLSKDSIDWYSHIADASEELVGQVQQMGRDGLSPKDFGLYVKAHPDTLMVTARNKMLGAEEITLEQGFSGLVKETNIVSIDEKVNDHNFSLIDRYWKQGFGAVEEIIYPQKAVFFRDVATEEIEDFLSEFQCHSHFEPTKELILRYLRKIGVKRSKTDVVLLSKGGAKKGVFKLGSQERNSDGWVESTKKWRLSRYRVASKGDEKWGLNDDQIEQAKKEAGTDHVSDRHYRKVRDKPLLMIHSLEPLKVTPTRHIAAFSMSFPYGDYSTRVSVVANRVYLESLGVDIDDYYDEED